MVEINNLSDLKDFLKRIEKANIFFKPHFYEKKEKDRLYLDEKMVVDSLKNINQIQGFQRQIVNDEERYRLGIKLSNKYNLVIIFKIESKNLYIITAWKTNRKWQKAMKK